MRIDAAPVLALNDTVHVLVGDAPGPTLPLLSAAMAGSPRGDWATPAEAVVCRVPPAPAFASNQLPVNITVTVGYYTARICCFTYVANRLPAAQGPLWVTPGWEKVTLLGICPLSTPHSAAAPRCAPPRRHGYGCWSRARGDRAPGHVG